MENPIALAFLQKFRIKKTYENEYPTADRSRGWSKVQKLLPKIIEYGRAEGILQSTCNVTTVSLTVNSVIIFNQFEVLEYSMLHTVRTRRSSKCKRASEH